MLRYLAHEHSSSFHLASVQYSSTVQYGNRGLDPSDSPFGASAGSIVVPAFHPVKFTFLPLEQHSCFVAMQPISIPIPYHEHHHTIPIPYQYLPIPWHGMAWHGMAWHAIPFHTNPSVRRFPYSPFAGVLYTCAPDICLFMNVYSRACGLQVGPVGAVGPWARERASRCFHFPRTLIAFDDPIAYHRCTSFTLLPSDVQDRNPLHPLSARHTTLSRSAPPRAQGLRSTVRTKKWC